MCLQNETSHDVVAIAPELKHVNTPELKHVSRLTRPHAEAVSNTLAAPTHVPANQKKKTLMRTGVRNIAQPKPDAANINLMRMSLTKANADRW